MHENASLLGTGHSEAANSVDTSNRLILPSDSGHGCTGMMGPAQKHFERGFCILPCIARNDRRTALYVLERRVVPRVFL